MKTLVNKYREEIGKKRLSAIVCDHGPMEYSYLSISLQWTVPIKIMKKDIYFLN